MCSWSSDEAARLRSSALAFAAEHGRVLSLCVLSSNFGFKSLVLKADTGICGKLISWLHSGVDYV